MLFLLICMIMSSITVAAADERLGTVVDGSLLTDGTEATGNTQTLARGTYLSYGTGTLNITGTRSVNVSGSTSCYKTCDKVKVTLYLERLVGDKWVNVSTVPTKTAYNVSYVSNSKAYSVTGGYYYRVQGSHVAIKGSTSEATASYTDGVWVS